MREQLIQYVDLLFAGAENCEEIKQEILQNTLDRYDDLIAEGKVPEAAYRLAITASGTSTRFWVPPELPPPGRKRRSGGRHFRRRKLSGAVAVALYILCPIPLFVCSEIGVETVGLCGTLVFVAIATALMVLGAKKERAKPEEPEEIEVSGPKSELNKSVSGLIWAIGLALYFIISFATMAWYITWVIFPLIGAVTGLVRVLLGDDSKKQLNKGIGGLIWAVGLALYFIVSFATNAWYVTWVIFLITGAAQGLAKAILDLMEGNSNEA